MNTISHFSKIYTDLFGNNTKIIIHRLNPAQKQVQNFDSNFVLLFTVKSEDGSYLSVFNCLQCSQD